MFPINPSKAFRATLKKCGIKFTPAQIATAYATHCARAERFAKRVPDPLTSRPRIWHTVPAQLPDEEIRQIHDASPRIKRWASPRNTLTRRDHGYVGKVDQGRYSSRCTYKKIDHTPLVYAQAYATPSGCYLLYRYGRTGQTTIKAPRGWSWKADSNGMALVSRDGKAEYHPTSNDLRQDAPGKLCAAKARENAATRAAALADKRKLVGIVSKAGKAGVFVSVPDSLAAGNCRAGTWRWMNAHGFSATADHISAAALAKFGDIDNRVALVVLRAVRRTKLELQRGYSLLTDHWLDFVPAE